MPTTKRRLNITLTPELEALIKLYAERDEVPEATKAVEFIKLAIDVQEAEEARMALVGDERLSQKVKYVDDSEDIWS